MGFSDVFQQTSKYSEDFKGASGVSVFLRLMWFLQGAKVFRGFQGFLRAFQIITWHYSRFSRRFRSLREFSWVFQMCFRRSIVFKLFLVLRTFRCSVAEGRNVLKAF